MAWSDEQRHNAGAIISTGRKLGASNRDITIALMAAIVESGLRNLKYGDRDSVGLFQQRNAWGSFAERTNPVSAATMFFQGGHQGQRGLFDFHNRNSMSMGSAAQAVQVSAFPGRYAAHEGDARTLLGIAPQVDLNSDYHTNTSQYLLGGEPGLDDMSKGVDQRPVTESSAPIVDPLGAPTADSSGLGAVGMNMDGTSAQNAALDALSFDTAGPSAAASQPVESGSESPGGQASGGGGGGGAGGGFSDPMSDLHMPDISSLFPEADLGNNPVENAGKGWRQSVIKAAEKMLGTPYSWGGTGVGGVDCSGLIKYAFGQNGIDMPRISADQANTGQRVGLNQLDPGDLVAWDNSSRNNGADHIALYIGNGQIIEAARPGTNVQVSNIYDQGRAWGVKMGAQQLTPGQGAGKWGVQSYVEHPGEVLARKFGISDVGGFADRNIAGTGNKSDHAYGLALDFMGGKQDLADYAKKNADKLDVKYVIYNHHIWSAERADEGWRPYNGENPHTDHVHISFNQMSPDAFSYRPPTSSAFDQPKAATHSDRPARGFTGETPRHHSSAPAPAPQPHGSPRSVEHQSEKPKPKKPRGTHGGRTAV